MPGKYYVHFPQDPRADIVGPYKLTNAKAYARIGSSHGGPRLVTRGIRGRTVREYRKGKRTYPVSSGQLRGMSPGEKPRLLHAPWSKKGVENPAAEPRMFVRPLAAYNQGYGFGAWVDIDSDEDLIWDEIGKVLKASPVKGEEEWAIHDYDEFPDMGEYPDVEALAAVATAMEDYPAGAVEAAKDQGVKPEDLADYMEEAFTGQWEDEEDYAWNYLEDQGAFKEMPELLQNYFDIAAYTRDLFIDSMWSTSDGEGGVFVFYRV